MDKWFRCIKSSAKQSQDNVGEEIEMKPIGRNLYKNYMNVVYGEQSGNIKRVSAPKKILSLREQYRKLSDEIDTQTNQSKTKKLVNKLSELELLEHPVTKEAISRGLVCRVIPKYQMPTFQLESFGTPMKNLETSTGITRIDGELAGNFSKVDDKPTLHLPVNQYAHSEGAKQTKTDDKAHSMVVPRKLYQLEDKHSLQNYNFANETNSAQYFEYWTIKNKNKWVKFENSGLSVTYKINSAVIEDSISLIDGHNTEYGNQLQRLNMPNIGCS